MKNKEYKDYIAQARENLQDNEMNYILFHNEVQQFTEKLQNIGDKKLSDTILQYSAFNLVHFNLKIGEAIQAVIVQKPEDLALFKNNPKFAHIGLHQNIQLEENQLPEFMRGCNWTFPSICLLTKNAKLFNNITKNYGPMLSMLFPTSEDEIKNGDHVYQSYLQALIQGSGDPDILFNTLEHHPSIFIFSEIYHTTMSAIKSKDKMELKVFKTRTVKSWFSFLESDARSKWLEDLMNAADEAGNKDDF